ncbi:disulfide bond formation protein B [Alphaproteobacteria bacterium KMM 3653]|uniref:Putative protein-disulfide oxidoreductase DsbI n=1 Tax=Harenicola maris TaxID=2841044 RepID=A0AAP2G7T5_9RHOB|nr:disulfide bond formation protein B [Harenicola maris]
MTKRDTLVTLALLGSAALLAGAWGFQHFGGLEPCKMCIWQRWPHGAAVILGVLVLAGAPRLFISLGAMAALTTAAIGLYHTGVEKGWWEGPTSCSGTGNGLSGLSGADLLSTEIAKPLVMCDQVVWDFLGLSMASWNALIALALVAIWLAAFRSRG